MKTVRFNEHNGNHVKSVSDKEASKLVQERKAKYCPKHWLKAAKSKERSEDG